MLNIYPSCSADYTLLCYNYCSVDYVLNLQMEPFGRLIYPVQIYVCYLLSRELFRVSAIGRYSWKDIQSQILFNVLSVCKRYSLTYLLTYLLTFLLTYFLTFSLTFLLSYLLTHLLTYVRTYFLT